MSVDFSREPDDVRQEAALLWRKHNSRLGQVLHQARRLFVRAFRIATGSALSVLSFFAGDKGLSIAQAPIASLSILDILALLFWAALTLMLIWGAFSTAFGKYDAPTNASDFVVDARKIVSERNTQRDLVAQYYAKSKLQGLLHDPSLGLQDKPWRAGLLKFAIVLGIYALLGLAIWLGDR